MRGIYFPLYFKQAQNPGKSFEWGHGYWIAFCIIKVKVWKYGFINKEKELHIYIYLLHDITKSA